ncbi:class I SAM-dependent methyltransferase [Streptomyces sp. AC627_RSS907]|uniref:class I SAM-dependent methyltransferase n=1 Tax=Streptomyces sp. AC627_RSS907 TaxID=2823684 RepID=UPI001C25CB0B|nr:class I SAM-dependent methyltransferase [Streptomyces sp. AC627_RSS907]
MKRTDPITIHEMYSPDDNDAIDRALNRSRDPRPPGSLFAMVGELGIGPDDVVLDIGGRDAWYSLRLAELAGCRAVSVDPVESNNARARAAVAGHPRGARVSIRPGVMEDIPASDGEFDLVFCRDMFFQVVDADKALAECHRVLRPGGHVLFYQSYATDRLEPRETAHLYADLAVVPERMSSDDFERRVAGSGLVVASMDPISSEWYEALEEDGTRTTSDQLLYVARLLRQPEQLRAELGDTDYRVELANALWGVYHMIGKLEPRIYVLRRPDA